MAKWCKLKFFCNFSQLKRTGNKKLPKGGILEDAITVAITAMNEPKTCSTTSLRRYLVDANKDVKENQLGKSFWPFRPECLNGTDKVTTELAVSQVWFKCIETRMMDHCMKESLNWSFKS